MKYFVWIFAVLVLFYTANLAFAAQENAFHVSSKLRFPEVLHAGEKAKFTISVTNKGPMDIVENLEPVIDVTPASATLYVHIETGLVEKSLWVNEGATISGNISVDKEIPVEQIFLSVSFAANDTRNNWVSVTDPNQTVSIKIEKSSFGEDNGKSLAESTKTCKEIILGAKDGTPIDLEYDIDGGASTSSTVKFCYSGDNFLVASVDAKNNGQLTVTIPKKMVYSLTSKKCEEGDLIILMDGEEALPTSTIHNKKDNVVTIEFPKGHHVIEFLGFSIIPDPAPFRYCGVVMGFDSQFLPPKFQVLYGMEIEQIRCNEGLELVIKSSNGNPACVKQSSIPHLVQISWITPTKIQFENYDDKLAYYLENGRIVSTSIRGFKMPDKECIGPGCGFDHTSQIIISTDVKKDGIFVLMLPIQTVGSRDPTKDSILLVDGWESNYLTTSNSLYQILSFNVTSNTKAIEVFLGGEYNENLPLQ